MDAVPLASQRKVCANKGFSTELFSKWKHGIIIYLVVWNSVMSKCGIFVISEYYHVTVGCDVLSLNAAAPEALKNRKRSVGGPTN